jgi:putative transposase
MARRKRQAYDDAIYHVMNRGNCRMRIFGKAGDYLAFLKLMEEGRKRTGMRILAYCLMPNHWHMVLWPRKGEDLSAFLGWTCSTHVRRWREHRHNVGEGHLYQGRFKSFPVQPGPPLYRVLRYVEGNARRATLAERAEAWPYGSLYAGARRPEHRVELSPWPVPRPEDWTAQVNKVIEKSELDLLHLHIRCGRPLGSREWTAAAVKRMGLEQTMRDRGRPKKEEGE